MPAVFCRGLEVLVHCLQNPFHIYVVYRTECPPFFLQSFGIPGTLPAKPFQIYVVYRTECSPFFCQHFDDFEAILYAFGSFLEPLGTNLGDLDAPNGPMGSKWGSAGYWVGSRTILPTKISSNFETCWH